MSSTKIILSLVMVAFVAACGGHTTEDVVYVDEPVTVEPTYTGKYN
jgi:hypothetical protein